MRVSTQGKTWVTGVAGGPRLRRWVRSVLCGMALVATTPLASALEPACAELGAALTSHSCFHAKFGPFQTVVAAADVPATAPAVDDVHTFYDVVLPTPTGRNIVSYQVASPARAGVWAIFHDPTVPVQVWSQSGAVLPIRLSQDVPSCPFLPRADVYELAAERYRIVLGPAVVTRSVLVIENVADFVRKNGRDKDGDGHGDPSDVVLSACRPPAEFVENADDCNDLDPLIHPGRPEICDGVDQNCNGVIDDIGLPCYAGLGACRAAGVSQCPAAGAPAVCSARALSPKPEACDGVDDDCNGVVDVGEDGLCRADVDAPACVLALGKTRCGCDVDAQCGGTTSERVCDLGERRCKRGCVAAPGRNGCPPPQVCTSVDPATPGTCVAPGALDAGASEGGGASVPDAGPPEGSVDRPGSDGCACHTTPATSAGSLSAAPLVALATLAFTLRRTRRARRASRGSRGMAVRLAAGGVLVFALARCGGKVELSGDDAARVADAAAPPDARGPRDASADVVADAGACVPALGPKVVDHACSHATHGPFDQVVAAAGPPTTPPPVDTIHHAFDVILAPGDSPHRGLVAYTPARSGPHALLTKPKAALGITGPSGAKIAATAIVDVASSCGALEAGRVANLTAGEKYTFELEGPAREMRLFIEHLPTFDDEAWSRECP